MILVYSVLQGRLQRTSFSSRDTWYIWNQTCVLFYREFWLFSGNSKHCRHDADPECLCGPLKPEVSGCKSDFFPKLFIRVLLTLGFPLLKLPRDCWWQSSFSLECLFYCAPDIVPKFFLHHVILSSVWTWEGGITVTNFGDRGTEKLSNLTVARPELVELPFTVQILTMVLLTIQK